MADISTLEAQANLLMGNVTGWEQSVINRIAKRIGKTGKMSVADAKALNNIAIVKQDMEEITKALAKVTGLNVSQMQKMYGDLLTKQHLANSSLYDFRNKKFVPFAENESLQAIVKAYSKTTAGNMVNLSKIGASHLGMLDKNGKFKPLEKFYTEALDKAVVQVASGATDFHTAMRDTITAMGGSGIRVNYPGTDITRRLDTTIRQSLLWGAKQASNEYNEMLYDELGCDGYEIDYHSNPRPSHEFMQGKQFVVGKARKINGIHFDSFDEAEKRLNDYGCLHFKTPIICGISEPTYSETELARLKQRDKQTFDINGKQMTGYEATQAMRRLETGVREQKAIREAAKQSGDVLLERRCTERIKLYQNKYNEISDITGIDKEPKRMSIPKGTSTLKILTNNKNSGIIVSNRRIGELATPYPDDKIPMQTKKYLQQLQKYGDSLEVDSPITFEEMGLLSRQTGNEFASITIDNKHFLVRGDETKTPLPNEILSRKGTLNCHSHPYIGDVRPSPEDLDVALKMQWQEDFYIISPDNKEGIYTAHGIVEIKDINRGMTSKEGLELYKKLFEEG